MASDIEFSVRSVRPDACLVLSQPDRDTYLATLSHGDLRSHERVNHLCEGGFAAFWARLSDSWRGWDGRIEWESLEAQLVLGATSDRLGHVGLEVELCHGAPPVWSARSWLVLEAGQLESLATQAARFESALYAASASRAK